ncbi:alpha/beta fold hydrolase [Arenicella xantha]|nr:alpha/beta hydrolase [Arenicella xantha]
MINQNSESSQLARKSSSFSGSGMADLTAAVDNPPKWLHEAMQVPREEGFVTVDGCDIRYFRWGDRTKPSIIMLHGFLAHSRCWAFIAPFLAEHYHVVAYDMSGMGDSGKRDAYPIEVRIDELLGVTEQTGLFGHESKPTIIAHSYGGQVAVSAVHEHPDKFAGMIICDLMIMRPSVLEANAEKFKPPGNQNASRPNRVYPDYPTAKGRFVLAPPQKVEVPELFDFMAFHSLREVDGGWQWKFDPGVFRREPGFETKWAKTGERVVSAPGRKAVIYGKKSYLFNDDSAAYLTELIDELEQMPFPIIDIPDARHHLMLDQPIALLTALKTVLAVWK